MTLVHRKQQLYLIFEKTRILDICLMKISGTVREYLRHSSPQGSPDCDRMHGAEVIAQETHAAQITFLRINTVSFDRDKNAHRAQIYAFVFVMAMMAPSAQVRIDVNFSSYCRCGSDFHEKTPCFLVLGAAVHRTCISSLYIRVLIIN